MQSPLLRNPLKRTHESLADDCKLQDKGVSVKKPCSCKRCGTSLRAATPNSFYRRKLPCPPAIAFSSDEGKKVFQEALLSGTMDTYFRLAEQFRTQDEPAFCGISSLVMTLNALAIDPGRVWKGPWRWVHESMLDCCQPLDVVKKEGINFDELACLARCNGAACEAVRATDDNLTAFRKAVQVATSPPGNVFMLTSYSRNAFQQTGDGHFSPIAGYHEERDLVLIMDVARFKYPPHWVKLPLLHEAMQRRDATTGKSRGWMLLQKTSQSLGSTILFAITDCEQWSSLKKLFRTDGPAVFKHYCKCVDPTNSIKGFVDCFLQSPFADCTILSMRRSIEFASASEHASVAQKLLQDLRTSPIFNRLQSTLSAESVKVPANTVETLTALIYILPDQFWDSLPAHKQVVATWGGFDDLSPALKNELGILKQQLMLVID